MAEITVSNPEMVRKRNVDEWGRIYLGQQYIGDEIEVVVTVVTDSDNEQDDSRTEASEENEE